MRPHQSNDSYCKVIASSHPKKPELGETLTQKFDKLTTITLLNNANESDRKEMKRHRKEMNRKRDEYLVSLNDKYDAIDSKKDAVSPKYLSEGKYILFGHQTEPACIEEIIKLAPRLEKFGLKLILPKEYSTNKNNITFDKSVRVGRWVQDSLAPHNKRGVIKTPYYIDPKDVRIKTVIRDDRTNTASRYKLFNERGTSIYINLGGVNSKGQQDIAIKLGKALGVTVEYQLSYAEGGNTLTWKKDNEVYCIIGYDTLAVAKYLAAKHLNKLCKTKGDFFGYLDTKGFNDPEIIATAIKMLAIDYGTKNLFFVEQPDTFHLDMRMAIAGHKSVLLNDAVAAQKIMVNYFENIEADQLSKFERLFINEFKERIDAMKKTKSYNRKKIDAKFWKTVRQETAQKIHDHQDSTKPLAATLTKNALKSFKEHLPELFAQERKLAEKAKIYETATKEKLIAEEFKVTSYPGSFYNPITGREEMNFFNMVTMKNSKNKKLAITLGCRGLFFERILKKMLKVIFPDEDYEHCMLGMKFTEESLVDHGGILCQVKTISTA